MNYKKLLTAVVAAGASDLHVTAGLPPMMRVHGQLQPLKAYEPMAPETIAAFIRNITTEEQRRQFADIGELDLSYGLEGVGRFRVNLFHQREVPAVVMRVINFQVPSFRELNLPPLVARLCTLRNGLVLVTGPTGSGKSTTLAAMIDYINEHRSVVIITLEDPIEYMHHHKNSIVNQREIGVDTRSFASGLRAALREDPDVILLGEMRDGETMEIALRAAETGHLVLSTLHTRGAAATIDRIIDNFPPHQQTQIRTQLAGVLQAVLSQQLLPRRDGQGRVAAFEVMTATPALRNLIREGKTHQLDSVIETGLRAGMQTMAAALQKLYQQGLITADEYEARLQGG